MIITAFHVNNLILENIKMGYQNEVLTKKPQKDIIIKIFGNNLLIF